ncbi:MAG: hypothetical protein AB7F31_02790 [Parachlamydiales bacterium]
MTAVKNRKLCWNCEGSVHIHATKCPFCSTDLTAGTSPHLEHVEPLSPYTPPNRQQKTTAPAPPYNPQRGYEIDSAAEEYGTQFRAEEPQQQVEEEEEAGPTNALPLLLLLPGIFFLLFGLVLVLFSHDGELTMRWNARYWFVYLLIAMPMLYFGWRTLGGAED